MWLVAGQDYLNDGNYCKIISVTEWLDLKLMQK